MKKWTLKRWLFLFSVLPCLAVMFLLGGYLTYRQFQVLDDGMRDLGFDITKQLANPRIFSTLAQDHLALQSFINALGEHEEIRSVSLLNAQKQLIGYSGPSYTHQHQPKLFVIHGKNPSQVVVTEDKQTLTFSSPIIAHTDVNRNEPSRKNTNAVTPLASLPKDAKPVTAPLSDHVVLGWVVVEIDRGYTLIKQYEVMYINFVIMLFGTILLMLLNYRISKRFVTPLTLIQEKIKRLQRGELTWSSELQPHTSFTKTITISPTKKFSLTFNEFVTIENGLEEISKLLKGKTEQYFSHYEQQTMELQENLAQLEVRNVEIEIDRKNAVKESRIKSELVAGMHHEIRAPLNGLISFVELLAETRLTPYQHEYLTHARIALRQLSTSINELVEAMLFDSNHFLLAKCPVDLRENVDEALLLLAPQAYQNQMELISYIYPDVPVKFLGDAARIKQLILHFGGQLLQLGRNGDLIIRVLNEEQENLSVWLRFEIIAKGLNVTADDYQRLLAFYGDEHNNEQQTHAALNARSFTLAKKLVYAMGGLISVHYEPKDDELAIHFRCCLERLAYREESLLTKELIHNQSVLIFDENPTARAALAQQCRFLNLSVLEAPLDLTLEKLIDAIASGKQECFDIAILGFNRFIYQEQKFRFLLEQMRQYFKGPIIVAVNTSDARLLEDIEFCGADFCLIKPVGYKKLQTTFYDLLRNYQLQNIQPTPLLSSVSSNNARVLVADDNPSNLQRLVYLLNEEGAQVASACNGQQAIQLAAQADYDLIYLDIKMPDLDGFEVAKRIRMLHKSYEHVPIIAVSAYLSEHEEGLLEAAGIDDYIIKPIKRAEVHGSLVKWYRRKDEKDGTEQGTSRIIPFRNLKQTEVNVEDDLLVETRPNKALKQTGVRNQWVNTMESDVKSPLSTASQFNDLKIVDWNAVVLSSNGNAVIAKEILGMLIDSLPEFKEQIYNDYTERDYKKLLDNVHKLHGSASYCGVPRLKEAAYQTEKLLKKEQFDELNMPIEALLVCIDEVLKVAPDYI